MLFDGMVSWSPLGHRDFACSMCRPSLAHTLQMCLKWRDSNMQSPPYLLYLRHLLGCQFGKGPFWSKSVAPPCILLGCFVPVEFGSPPWLYGQSAASWSSVMHVSHQPLIRAQPVKVSVERTVSSCYCQKVCSHAVMSLRWHHAVEGGFVYLFYNDQRLVAEDGKDKRLLWTRCWMLRSGPWMMWGT